MIAASGVWPLLVLPSVDLSDKILLRCAKVNSVRLAT